MPFQVLAEILGSGSVYTKGRGLGQVLASRQVRLGSGFVTCEWIFQHAFRCGTCGNHSGGICGAEINLWTLSPNLKAISSGVSDAECNAAKNRLRLKHANMSSSAQLDSMTSKFSVREDSWISSAISSVPLPVLRQRRHNTAIGSRSLEIFYVRNF